MANEAMRKEVINSMRCNPALIQQVHTFCKSIGLHADQTTGSGQMELHKLAANARNRAEVRASDRKKRLEERMFCARYTRVDRMTVMAIKKHGLCVAAPIGLSLPNVNTWLKLPSGGSLSADDAKEAVLQAFEFATGMRRETAIEGDLRTEEGFETETKKQAEKRGFRGNNLSLPPNWPVDGICRIMRVSTAICVRSDQIGKF